MRAVARNFSQHPHSPPPELDPRTFHSYPAGAFLVDVPSVWLGLPSMGLAQILLFIALSVAIVAAAPPETRLALTAVLWANPTLVQRVVNGDFDIWWLAALIAAWMLRERRWSSGALLGVACAVKQTAWIAAPFYLIWVWREHGFSEALRRTGIALATFLVINLPWILLSPRAWLESLLLPLSLPLLPDGSGLIALGQAGIGLLPARAHIRCSKSRSGSARSRGVGGCARATPSPGWSWGWRRCLSHGAAQSATFCRSRCWRWRLWRSPGAPALLTPRQRSGHLQSLACLCQQIGGERRLDWRACRIAREGIGARGMCGRHDAG